MGYIAHDAVVAVIADYKTDALAAIEAFRDELEVDVLGTDWAKFLLGPVDGINGYTTYVWAPDGSKEGWGESNTGDQYRERFIALAKTGDMIHVRFGGDYGHEMGARIIATDRDSAEVTG